MTAMQPAPGAAFDDAALDAYLADQSSWRSGVSTELLDLDEQVKVAGLPDAAADVALAFSLWRAANIRVDEAVAARGTGRLGGDEREAVQALVWAPIVDDGGSPVAANLPEARTLIDALVERLRSSVTQRGEKLATVTGLLAPITERIRIASTNATALGEMVRQVAVLDTRLERLGPDSDPTTVAAEVTAIARELAPIERDLAELARAKSSLVADTGALPARVHDAVELEAATRTLAVRCQEKIADPPNLAVPAVTVIGAPPTLDDVGSLEWRAGRAAVDAYVAKLSRVERALHVANAAYAAPLQRRDDLRGLLDGYRAMAASRGLGEQADASSAYDVARAALHVAPCDIEAAAALVDAYQQIVNGHPTTPSFPEDKRA